MPKLTKQEVNAIAGKLHRDLEEKLRLEKLRAIHEYIPSKEYLEVENNLKRIQELKKEIARLEEEKRVLGHKTNQVLDSLEISRDYWAWWDNADYYGDYLERIIKKEVRVPSVPSIEELKDDITIAAIDSDFDVEDYLKTQLEKY